MNAFLKLQQIRKICYGRKRNRSKTTEQITSFVYLDVILFRMHEGATEKEFHNNVLQMTPEFLLTQRFKKNTK